MLSVDGDDVDNERGFVRVTDEFEPDAFTVQKSPSFNCNDRNRHYWHVRSLGVFDGVGDTLPAPVDDDSTSLDC